MNGFRTTILLAALTALVVWIGQMFGGANGAVIALVFAGAMNFFSYWFSDKIVLKMYGAQEISANDDPELYGIVRELAGRAGLLFPHVASRATTACSSPMAMRSCSAPRRAGCHKRCWKNVRRSGACGFRCAPAIAV